MYPPTKIKMAEKLKKYSSGGTNNDVIKSWLKRKSWIEDNVLTLPPEAANKTKNAKQLMLREDY